MLMKLLNKLRTKIPTLWYENDDGVRWIPPSGYNGDEPPPKGFIYQWSQFPTYLEESCLRLVVKSEVDECDHDPEYIKRTGGWIDGVRGRECRLCNGTQVVNDKDRPDGSWPDEWEASGSRSLMTGHSGYTSDVVMAMLRPSWIEIARQIYRYGVPAIPFTDFDQAVLYVAKSCERCLNVLCYRHGINDGYPKGSKEWAKAGTSCELCDSERVKEYDPEHDLI